MKGFHEVKVFKFLAGYEDGVELPENWKPFAVTFIEQGKNGDVVLWVIARKWHRS